MKLSATTANTAPVHQIKPTAVCCMVIKPSLRVVNCFHTRAKGHDGASADRRNAAAAGPQIYASPP
jgi:hypothetical protein